MHVFSVLAGAGMNRHSLNISIGIVVQQELHHLLMAGTGAVEEGRPTSNVLLLQLSTVLHMQSKQSEDVLIC